MAPPVQLVMVTQKNSTTYSVNILRNEDQKAFTLNSRNVTVFTHINGQDQGRRITEPPLKIHLGTNLTQ
jgi:hypothetical protein